jgi:hypothetical protein
VPQIQFGTVGNGAWLGADRVGKIAPAPLPTRFAVPGDYWASITAAFYWLAGTPPTFARSRK